MKSPETPQHSRQGDSGEYVLFTLSKESKMNSNQKSSTSNSNNQGSKQGSNQSNKQSGTAGSSSGARTGTQGGTHEQHVEAGRQSHKNDGNKQSGNR
jgi:hypothetical protein